MSTSEALRGVEERFDEEFPDPITKKYGDGFVLMCTLCDGKKRDDIKAFIRSEFLSYAKGLGEKSEDGLRLHVCGFNDLPQVCGCYRKAVDDFKSALNDTK